MGALTTTATSSGLSGIKLTAAIRQEHDAASRAAQSAIQHALAAGRLLAEAKRKIPHGSWESYVKDSCGIAPRTASLYQRLHRHRDRLPNRQHVAELSVRQAARLLERPKATAETVAPLPAVAVEQGNDLRLRVPEWYRAGLHNFGLHPSGWFFEVWPHPAGEQCRRDVMAVAKALMIDKVGACMPELAALWKTISRDVCEAVGVVDKVQA